MGTVHFPLETIKNKCVTGSEQHSAGATLAPNWNCIRVRIITYSVKSFYIWRMQLWKGYNPDLGFNAILSTNEIHRGHPAANRAI
jgi:hypothetical protein